MHELRCAVCSPYSGPRVSNDLLRAGLRNMQQRPRLTPYEPPAADTGRPLINVADVAEALERLDEP